MFRLQMASRDSCCRVLHHSTHYRRSSSRKRIRLRRHRLPRYNACPRVPLECSRKSECCVLAISNPFEITVPESLRDQKKSFSGSTWFEYVQEYEEPQQKQTDRFLRLGFQQIDISESIQDQERCPPEHCLIYVPDRCDGDFVERLKPRLLPA